MKRIYMDNAATTPVDKNVIKEMAFCMKNNSGNPSSIHKEGVLAKKLINKARENVASFFNAHSDEIVFMGGGTEANNIAILGVFENLLIQGRNLDDLHAVTSVIEHPAVIDVFRSLEKKGLSVTYVGVDETGTVNIQDIKESLQENTILVSIMHANNEIGTVQPIAEIAKIIRNFRKAKGQKMALPFFHTDACQSVQILDINLNKLGVDLMSMSASKIYGPKGVGILYVKRGTIIAPIMHGGGQENGLRAGTENTTGIVGCSAALSVVKNNKDKDTAHLSALRKYFLELIHKEFPESVINGDGEQLPHIINVSFFGMGSEELVLRLDAKGIAVASKSACKSEDENVSYVVSALGVEHHPESALRFSMGRDTNKKDIDYTIKSLEEILKK